MNVIINSESNETQQQIVSFSDQTQQWVYSVDNPLDDQHHMMDSTDATLDNFFSRPIKIASINWTVGSTFGTTINPWQAYFENLRVINRITNYNYLRAKLCVRIMINGNGFHYGRALASYRPLHNEDDMIAWRYGLVPQDTIAASQRMHVWIDPTKSQGGTLCLPFVYYKNGLCIPDQDWRNMGELDIASVTSLLHANGGTDSVTISVFAWAEDVSLSAPTIAEPGSLAPQAGEFDSTCCPSSNETVHSVIGMVSIVVGVFGALVKLLVLCVPLCLPAKLSEQAGEYTEVGPISGPAAAVQRVAGVLSKVPQIRSFARATEMAAGVVGTIAKTFGMSRPVDTRGVATYRPQYAGNLANSNVLDTSNKLSFDVQQELTIDPIAVGMGSEDEMAMVNIARRESYLTQFPWSTGDAPETLLWNCYVEPILYDTASPSGVTEYHYTPMAWTAFPFENWRGSIKYRFQIVASAFHKGRIKIVYDPYFNVGGASEYNTQQTHIIDLAKERDFTIEVKWGQEYSYLDHRDFGFVGLPFSTSMMGGALHGQANGIIAVYVVNDLTTPSATLSDVSVLVSVSAGDDFEVANPHDSVASVAFWQPQFGEFEEQAGELNNADSDLTQAEAKPVDVPQEQDMGVSVQPNNAQLIYFADPIVSVRQILKRFVKSHTLTSELGGTGNYITFVYSDFPVYRGYATGLLAAMHNAATPIDPTGYNYTQTNVMQWFTVPFLARRGGIRYKYVYTGDHNANGFLSISRLAEAYGYTVGVVNTTAATYSAQVASASRKSLDGFPGSYVTPVELNPAAEVELPFQSNLRFMPARRKNFNAVANDFNKQHQVRFPLASTPGAASVNAYVAAAEDFSLSFFQACPVFWRQNDPTPSATL